MVWANSTLIKFVETGSHSETHCVCEPEFGAVTITSALVLFIVDSPKIQKSPKKIHLNILQIILASPCHLDGIYPIVALIYRVSSQLILTHVLPSVHDGEASLVKQCNKNK